MRFFIAVAVYWVVLPAIAVGVATVAIVGVVRLIDECRHQALLARLWDDEADSFPREWTLARACPYDREGDGAA